MPAQLIDGKTLAASVLAHLTAEIEKIKNGLGRPPGLAVVMVGDNAGSQVYVRNKRRLCADLGIQSFAFDLPAETPEDKLLKLVVELNRNPDVDGILVQAPLPPHISFDRVIETIDPDKDVDGFHPINMGRLLSGHPVFVPCTPAGIMEMIRSTGVTLAGKKAVVVGRSHIVGKPMALLLLQEHATVTICHTRTQNLAAECAAADVLIVAVGKPLCVRGAWVKPGALVVDVGINRENGKLCGDVEFEAARERAAFITPVPGGVGPMTNAELMANTVLAAWRRMEEKA